jgi:hypothetical protein
MPVLTDAGPARGQLQDMAVRGFPVSWIAGRIGASGQGLYPIRSGKQARTHTYTAAAINRLYQQLRGSTSADHGISEGPAAFNRLITARGGWTARPDNASTTQQKGTTP